METYQQVSNRALKKNEVIRFLLVKLQRHKKEIFI
jgi:hypothetical protein